MYAVVFVNGFQYTINVGETLAVQKMEGPIGSEVSLSEVLMIGDGENSVIGTPAVPGAFVKATIIEQGKGDKVIVFKKKRRKGYKKKKGHRQELTWLRIDDIVQKAAAKKKVTKKAEPAHEEE